MVFVFKLKQMDQSSIVVLFHQEICSSVHCSDNSKIEDAKAVFVAQRKNYLSILCECVKCLDYINLKIMWLTTW